MIINFYCDESCHLENDHRSVMVLGCVWTPKEHVRTACERIRTIKAANGFNPHCELKWTKVSRGGLALYREIMEEFFRDPELHFRALLVPDKSILRHGHFRQTHDDWYYKMYFNLLKVVLDPVGPNHIYLDIKDTHGRKKVAKLQEVLANSRYDFDQQIIQRVQQIRSHEVELLQLADLMIGAVAYHNRGLAENEGKRALVKLIQQRSGHSLDRNTLLRELKVNLFRWVPGGDGTHA